MCLRQHRHGLRHRLLVGWLLAMWIAHENSKSKQSDASNASRSHLDGCDALASARLDQRQKKRLESLRAQREGATFFVPVNK